MMPETRRIFEQAMALPAREREYLAEMLLVSVDPADQKEIEAAWAEEIERRLRDYESGKVQAIPWEQVMDELKRKLR